MEKSLFEDLITNIIHVVSTTADFIKANYEMIGQKSVSMKGRRDLVTSIDVESEVRLKNGLKVLLPGAEFIAEESGYSKSYSNTGTYWVIDPLDGTTNFVHGIPVFSISVGLIENGEVVLGVVYDIMHSECFSAFKGGGAWMNGKIIKVSETIELENSVLATGFPFRAFHRLDEYIEVLKQFMMQSRGIRRMGSAAIDLVYVACGRFNGFFEYDLQPWDVAAGSIIIQEAGGKITDFKGGNDFLFGKEIVGANPVLISKMLEIVNCHFKGR